MKELIHYSTHQLQIPKKITYWKKYNGTVPTVQKKNSVSLRQTHLKLEIIIKSTISFEWISRSR